MSYSFYMFNPEELDEFLDDCFNRVMQITKEENIHAIIGDIYSFEMMEAIEYHSREIHSFEGDIKSQNEHEHFQFDSFESRTGFCLLKQKVGFQKKIVRVNVTKELWLFDNMKFGWLKCIRISFQYKEYSFQVTYYDILEEMDTIDHLDVPFVEIIKNIAEYAKLDREEF